MVFPDKYNFLTLLSIALMFIIITSCKVLGTDEETGTVEQENNWLIPADEIMDGGPGKDGIPSIDNPHFAPADEIDFIPDNRLIIGLRIGEEIRAYPHQILDWHEIINDQIGDTSFSIVYCPLTGTGMAWNRNIDGNVTEFGVSGLLFRNNLIAYDRNTDSNWSQMQLRSVNGPHSGRDIEIYQVVETTWKTWKELYPESRVHTTETGHGRNYTGFTYGADYATNHNRILFPVANRDERLQNKKRVFGIIGKSIVGMGPKVYILDEFGQGVSLIEDRVGGDDYIIAGSSEYNFAVAFQPETGNGISPQFEAVQDQLPVIMKDNEGNIWDLFGYAVEGPRQGERLTTARSYTGYWFAWADFFPWVQIYEGE